VEQRQQAREKLGLPLSGSCLLFVGNDFRKKGLAAVLESMSSIPAGVWLAVVGEGEQGPAMRERATQLGLSERVHFLGFLDTMKTAYCAADMLVHPTLEDSYAMVVLEAMAHGLPVVVSSARFCGISAELRDRQEAIILDEPTSATLLAAAVTDVLDNTALAQTLSRNATRFASGRTWQLTASHYDELFQSLCKSYRQRWLVLSHAFNMDGRAASQTITDKLPHLEEAGIEVVVLSGVSGRKDTHFEHYQLWPAGPAGIRFELRHVLRNRLGSGPLYRMVMVALSIPLLPFMLIEKLLRPVESSWSWWLSAYVKGRWLCRDRKFDLIYSTGGAFAAHVAGMHLKKALKIRWLAEVHDPLVTPGREAVPGLSAQEEMQARVERWICTYADIAIWFTDQALASARRRNPALGDRGKMVIPGVDEPKVILEPYRPTAHFVIGHFGSLSGSRNVKAVVHALERLIAARPELSAIVQLHLYGGPLDPVSQRATESSPVKHAICHFGRIEADPVTGKSGREQILQRMRSADVLLLLHGEDPICEEYIPSKFYEYLWMRRPIIGLVHKNPQLTALLQEMGNLNIATGESGASHQSVIETMDNAINGLVDQWANKGLPDRSATTHFTTGAAVKKVVLFAIGNQSEK
jgi:glycosyltransferase involved in cell wall biosynthesis